MLEKLEALTKYMNQKAKIAAKKDVPVSPLTKNNYVLGETNLDNSKSIQENSKESKIKGSKNNDL